MALSSLALRRPVTMLMFYAGVILAGIVSVQRLSIDFLPPVSVPRLTIHTTCPDFSPEEMDEKVAQPIASAVGTVAGVRKTSSVCRRGTAIVTVEFSWGVNMDYAALEVREKLDRSAQELPPEAERPAILRTDPSVEPVLTLGVTSEAAASGDETASLAGLTETCNALLKKRLEQVEGVAQVLVLGGAEREVRVDLDEKNLLALGLTVDDVVRAVNAQNSNLPGGTIRSGSLSYPLRLVGGLSTCAEVTQLSFSPGGTGRAIRLGEIASVHDTTQERSAWTRFNGREILVLQVHKEAGSSTLAVSESVRQAVTRLSREYPALRLDVLLDQAEFIRSSVADVEGSVVWGALLAFLVLFLFLKGVGDPLIVGLTMPVSILATLVAMNALGLTLNVISLTGLALGIGMLGDNAIIVIENVRRLQEGGLSRREAIAGGTREITLAVTASTLTNVAVFLPVLFVRSVAQQLFVDMAVTMTVSLLVSLFVAVTLVPLLLAWKPGFLRGDTGRGILGRAAGWLDASSQRWMDRILRRVLRSRGWVVSVTLMLFGLSALLAGFISSEPAPEVDRHRFIVDVEAGPGTASVALVGLASKIEPVLCRLPGASGVYAAGGIAASPDERTMSDVSSGHLHLEVTVADSVPVAPVMEQAREKLRSLCRSLAGVEFSVKPGATTFERILRPRSHDIIVRVQGSDPEIGSAIAAAFARQIRSVPGLADVSVPSLRKAPEYSVQIDRTAAACYGISLNAVAEHISRQTAGENAAVLSDADRQAVVRVQPERLKEKRIEDLLSSYVLCSGVPVRLSQLVQCKQSSGHTEIRRENGTSTAVITANAAGRSIEDVANGLRQEAASCALPPGYSIDIGGENEDMEASFRSLAIVIGLSVILVYMILAAEYESLLYPFVILLTSPLAFTGAVLAMLLAGEKYNVMSLIGIVVMIGAVDNDAVIAVDVITALRRGGASLHEAVCCGMRQRLRPILMTTATTVLGILPLIFSPGSGSDLVRALTIPLAGGLVSSTIFTLTVIPAVYTYLDPWVAKSE